MRRTVMSGALDLCVTGARSPSSQSVREWEEGLMSRTVRYYREIGVTIPETLAATNLPVPNPLLARADAVMERVPLHPLP